MSRLRVESPRPLPDWDWQSELTAVPTAWPFLGPTWLRATERALPAARPWHTVAQDGPGQVAYLPGFLFDRPPALDFDPRAYLGWTPPSGENACGVCGCSDSAAEVGALGESAFFPALLLGSPIAYRTEVVSTFEAPDLSHRLLEAALASASAQSVKTVIAPWVPQERHSERLLGAIKEAGGHAAFWGVEDYLDLSPDGYEAWLRGLSTKRRYRIKEDLDRVEEAGISIGRVEGAELEALVPRITQLTCLTKEKNQANEDPVHVETVLHALLEAGAGVRCYVARREGEVLGICVALLKDRRLYIKWAGFHYASLGDRSGVYFGLVLHAPIRDGYSEGLRGIEFGAGAHQAKALRGCLNRAKLTAMVATEPALRSALPRLLAAFGDRQRTEFGVAEQVQLKPSA